MTDEFINWAEARTPGYLAGRMLVAIDRSKDKLAAFAIPILAFTPDLADETEDIVRREFDKAKEERPQLAVQVVPTPYDKHYAALVYVHEHEWVGGYCVNGCPDKAPF
jgi:hypothetical protein